MVDNHEASARDYPRDHPDDTRCRSAAEELLRGSFPPSAEVAFADDTERTDNEAPPSI